MRRSKWILLVVAAVLVLGACAQVTGGGYIAGKAGGTTKATYGFNLTCDTGANGGSGALVGSWVYHDKYPLNGFKSVDVGATLTSTGINPTFCTPVGTTPGGGAIWYLPYGRQGTGCVNYFIGPNACPGFATVVAFDGATGGIASLKGDGLGIYLNGGVFDGYYNGSSSPFYLGGPLPGYGVTPKPILGGNIVITPTATSSPCC